MGTSLIRNNAPLGLYSRNMPRALWWSFAGGLFLMSEVPLCATDSVSPRCPLWGFVVSVKGLMGCESRAK